MAWTNVVTRATSYVVTSTNWNEFVNNFKAIGDSWTTYSPTWSASTTPPTLGTTTVSGRYVSAGKLIIGHIRIAVGTGFSAGSGTYSFTLPVTANTTSLETVGSSTFFDTSTSTTYGLTSFLASSTTINLVQGGSGGGRVTNSSPVAPANGDVITIAFQYEAA